MMTRRSLALLPFLGLLPQKAAPSNRHLYLRGVMAPVPGASMSDDVAAEICAMHGWQRVSGKDLSKYAWSTDCCYAHLDGNDISGFGSDANESEGWVVVLSQVNGQFRSPRYLDSHPLSVAAGLREGRELLPSGAVVYEKLRGDVRIVIDSRQHAVR